MYDKACYKERIDNEMKRIEIYEEQIGIAQRLKDIRKSKGFTQEEMAKKIGVSISSYTKWESAVHGIPTKHLLSISKSLNVSLDLIMYGDTGTENINFDEYLKIVKLFSPEGVKQFKESIEMIDKLFGCVKSEGGE